MAEEVQTLYQTTDFEKEFGTVRLAMWPEGLVLWVGGRLRWKSWEDPEFAKTRAPDRP